MTDTAPDGLHKQVHDAPDWDAELNENFDIIQARLTTLQAQVDALTVPSLEDTYLAQGRTIAANAGVYRWDNGAATPASDFSVSDYYFFDWTAPTPYADRYQRDPGWLQTEPYTDTSGNWDMTFAPGLYFRLPRGRYTWDFFGLVNTNLTGAQLTQPYAVDMDVCSLEAPGVNNWQNNPLVGVYELAQSAMFAPLYFWGGAGGIEVLEDDIPFVPYLFLGPSGVGTYTVINTSFQIRRMW